MSLTVLSDEHVRTVVDNLTLDELGSFKAALSEALHEYSTNIQAADDGSYQQPPRISTRSVSTGCTTLYMPSSSPAGMGCKIVTLTSPGDDAADASQPAVRPTGAITLLSPLGAPVGFVHAETLTAFRTALASACLLAKRGHVRTLTVFGAGLQAYWHVRLALILHGTTIRTVNIINRRFSDSVKRILKKFYAVPTAVKQREGWEATQFGVLTPGYGEFNRLQREQIRDADVIYCCTPSMEPLFDASILTNHEGRRKGRLIVAVGSYTPEMRELPQELILQATKQYDRNHRHFHKHAPEGGVIVVDTLDGALKEAGEIIAAGVQPTQLVELGELVMLKRMAQEEASDAETQSTASIDSAEFESLKLDFSAGTPAMASVFSETSSSTDRTSLSGESAASSSQTGSSGTTTTSNDRHFSFRKRSSSHSSTERRQKKEDSLARWLSHGTVIYKSVGLGLMDLVVGMHLIKLAAEKKIGTHIDGF